MSETATPGTPADSFDVGAAWTWAWRQFNRHWKVLTLAVAPYLVALMIAYGAYLAVLIPATITDMRRGRSSPEDDQALVIALLGVYVAVLVISLLGSIAYRNLVAAALLVADGGTPTPRSALSLRRSGRTLTLALLNGILVLVGMVLCFLPGVVVAIFGQFAFVAMVEHDLRPVRALRRSWAFVRRSFWPSVLVSIVVGLIAYAGTFACLVGLLASLPIAALMQVHAYRSMSGGQIVA